MAVLERKHTAERQLNRSGRCRLAIETLHYTDRISPRYIRSVSIYLPPLMNLMWAALHVRQNIRRYLNNVVRTMRSRSVEGTPIRVARMD